MLFLALLPQFTDPETAWPIAVQIVVLGLVHVASCAVVYTGVGTGARRYCEHGPRRPCSGPLPGTAMIVDRCGAAGRTANRLDADSTGEPRNGEGQPIGARRAMEDERQPEQAHRRIQARIRASFERQGLMRHLGARLEHVGPGRVHIVLPNRPEVNQQHGYIHAGATSAIADSAGGYAAFTLFPENTAVLTVEYKINLLAPAVGDRIEAVGTVLKPGRTSPCQLKSSPSRARNGRSWPQASRP